MLLSEPIDSRDHRHCRRIIVHVIGEGFNLTKVLSHSTNDPRIKMTFYFKNFSDITNEDLPGRHKI